MDVKTLGELEQKVMKIVWGCQECSIKEVQRKLGKKRGLAYTTVATILQRLYNKGFVERQEQDGAYIFSPKLSKESYSKKLAKSFLNKFFSSFGDMAVASFAESIDQLSKEKRDHLLRLLKK